YEVVRVASRSDVDKQMDKVVEALALATKAQQITWTEEKPEIFSIEAETLTSPVYVTEFKGKKFVLFYEHEGSSTRKNVQTRPSLWILDLNNTKLYDCRDVLGIDILFRLVNTKKPDFSALDAMVDALVSSAIKDVVARMQLEGKKGEA
ncbi:MAG: hypothetical protein RML40_08875, partial [Bacteroidota bacterium]|nr:hypothetical protein [Candidatus Kapabacteria bacterium]MDW8220630.1 hypothetical protein [Bacteroidota bacterium]